VVLITGANCRIGYEAELALAGQGAQVITACRYAEKVSQHWSINRRM
jgi:NAD(P)-dependent dehydrogenase (short-subunit alcohol dehydrogenase family)